VYTGRIFMELAAQLHYNIRDMKGRGVYTCLGEWLEALVKMVSMWNQNGQGDQTGRAFCRLQHACVHVLQNNANVPRSHFYSFDAAMQSLPTQWRLVQELQHRWQEHGYPIIVRIWRALENTTVDADGVVRLDPWLVEKFHAMEREACTAELCFVFFLSLWYCSVWWRGWLSQGQGGGSSRGGGGCTQAGGLRPRMRRRATGGGGGN